MLTHRAIQLPRHYSTLYHIQNGDLQALAIGAEARLYLCMRGLIVNIYLHPAQRLRAAAAAHRRRLQARLTPFSNWRFAALQITTQHG